MTVIHGPFPDNGVVAVCNTGNTGIGMGSSLSERQHPAVRDVSEIWCVRDPKKFAKMRDRPSVDHPKSARLLRQLAGKMHRVLSGSVHERVDAQLAMFDPPSYVVPSSGMIVIATVLEQFPDHAVTLAGFSRQGWKWHPFSAERRLVDALVPASRLQRLDPDDQGA